MKEWALAGLWLPVFLRVFSGLGNTSSRPRTVTTPVAPTVSLYLDAAFHERSIGWSPIRTGCLGQDPSSDGVSDLERNRCRDYLSPRGS